MAQEIDLNEQEVKELEAAQAKEVTDSQVANHPQEEPELEINLMASVIIPPMIKFISDISLVNNGDKTRPIYEMTVSNDSVLITFRAFAQKLRSIKIGLLQSMQLNQIYFIDVNPTITDENDVIVYSVK